MNPSTLNRIDNLREEIRSYNRETANDEELGAVVTAAHCTIILAEQILELVEPQEST